MSTEFDKVLLTEGKGASASEIAAMLNNGGNQWSNNPWMYLIFLALFGNGRFGGLGGENQQSEIMSKLNSLSDQTQSNQNTNLAMDAINGNHEALHQIANALGVSFANVQSAVAQVQNAITQVGGQIGMSAERVINSVLLGNKDLTAALQTCCCENKTLQMQNFAAQQLQNSQNQAATMSRIDQLANGITQGFSAATYTAQQHANDIIQAGNANTQRIVDALNVHWQGELQQKYADAKLELSQLNQNATLIAALKTT